MKPDSQQAQWIMRYLLGELSEEEQSRLEEKYFADPNLFQEVRATRDDLIDAYLRGELSAHEREQFEKHFLASPHRRERVEFARTLMKTVDHAPHSAAPTGKQLTASRRNWFLIPQLSFTRSIVALAVLAIIFLGSWLLIRNSRTRVEEANRTTTPTQTNQPGPIKEPAASPDKTQGPPDLANLPPATPASRTTPDPKSDLRIATFTLTPGVLRDSQAKVLVIPRNLNQVELRLEVEGEPYQSYQAELRTPEGDRKWSRAQIRPESDISPQTVVVRLPAVLFESADYVLRLSGITLDNEVIPLNSFYFRVERK